MEFTPNFCSIPWTKRGVNKKLKRKKPLCKMLLKFSILLRQFHQNFKKLYFHLNFTKKILTSTQSRDKLGVQISYEKAVCKMLMKPTPQINQKNCHKTQTRLFHFLPPFIDKKEMKDCL
jgi:hypothetical protein